MHHTDPTFFRPAILHNVEKKTGRVDPAELTRGRVDSGAELVSGRLDPLPFYGDYFANGRRSQQSGIFVQNC